jgi:hypothetical protein
MLEELIHHPMRKSRREKEAGGGGESGKGKANKETSLPVFEVEKAIERIGTLLQLGLGEAGAKIISENMRAGNIMLDQVTCSSDRINALESFYQIEYGFNHDGPTHRFESKQGGALVHAIFGFCDIRNFTDCTEVRIPSNQSQTSLARTSLKPVSLKPVILKPVSLKPVKHDLRT